MTLLQIVFFILLLGGLLLVAAVQTRWERLRNLAGGLLISYVTVLVVLVGGEVYLRYVYADSGWLWTRAGQNWLDFYVDLNTLGFRDREWTPADYDDKITVLCFGDSFTMGLGINDPADRYTDVLGELLGPDYAVINIGMADTATRDQLRILQDYPLQDPNIIIWQYLLNDVNAAGLSVGDHWWPTMPLNQPPFVDESHLANFLYWNLAPLFTEVDVTDANSYWDWAYYAYDNYLIWAVHRDEIREMMAYVESTGARLIVVIYPNVLEPVESIPYVDRVADFIRELGGKEILKLYDDVAYFITHREESVVVSRRDAHPSVAFNHYLAHRIYDEFFAGKADQPSP